MFLVDSDYDCYSYELKDSNGIPKASGTIYHDELINNMLPGGAQPPFTLTASGSGGGSYTVSNLNSTDGVQLTSSGGFVTTSQPYMPNTCLFIRLSNSGGEYWQHVATSCAPGYVCQTSTGLAARHPTGRVGETIEVPCIAGDKK